MTPLVCTGATTPFFRRKSGFRVARCKRPQEVAEGCQGSRFFKHASLRMPRPATETQDGRTRNFHEPRKMPTKYPLARNSGPPQQVPPKYLENTRKIPLKYQECPFGYSAGIFEVFSRVSGQGVFYRYLPEHRKKLPNQFRNRFRSVTVSVTFRCRFPRNQKSVTLLNLKDHSSVTFLCLYAFWGQNLSQNGGRLPWSAKMCLVVFWPFFPVL